MVNKLGPLFRSAVQRMHDSVGMAGRVGEMAFSTHVGVTMDEAASGQLPIVVKAPRVHPFPGESYEEYRERVEDALEPIRDKAANLGLDAEPLILGNALAGIGEPAQAQAIAADERVQYVELDPLLQVVNMDDAIDDVGVPTFLVQNGDLRGQGVSVAVLDSGVDGSHPFLNVTDAVSTCDEPADIPGGHGTHCAGSIASRDEAFPGIAPDVTLINVKVLDSFGRGTPTFITRGIEAAVARGADVLSMSLGFNHLPAWSNGGHGWTCSDGRCPLCTAVDNAVDLGRVVVVAAGNEHQRAESLRALGHGGQIDTELGCPGQARNAITVGALTKRTFVPAPFSSHGPTSYGFNKPDLAGPGVNIMSTLPVPRGSTGAPVPTPPRSTLFGRKSGTSMATPMVAGAAALLIQALRAQGQSTAPANVRAALLRSIRGMSDPALIVGLGRLDLSAWVPTSPVAVA